MLGGSEGLAAGLEAAFGGLKHPRSGGELRRRLDGGDLDALLAEIQDLSRSRLEAGAPPPTVAVRIDQGEELFGADGRAEADAFLPALAGALAVPHGQGAEAIAARRRALGVVAIRSESYVRLQTEPRLEGVRSLLFPLNPIARGEFKAVVEGPAARATEAGKPLAVEPALTRALLKDAEGADALPLLAFTLERLLVEHGADGDLRLDE